MLDMRLFARGTFTGALLVNLLSVVALVGFLFFVAQHLQLIVGLSPMQAGFALVPGMVAMIVSGLVVVPIAEADEKRQVVAYPDLGWSVEHRRVEAIAPAAAPYWMREALAAAGS